MICSIEGCGKQQQARGWCFTHYMRARRNNGDPLAGRVPNGEPERYFRQVVLTYGGDDCLEWPYGRRSNGYGQYNIAQCSYLVHRLACEEAHGPPPSPEHQAAHSCGKGHEGCVNPRHLSWKTPSENNADKIVHGTINRGERQPNSKLTSEEVILIRELKGMFSQREIGEKFGVTRGAVRDIQTGRNWAWLEGGAT